MQEPKDRLKDAIAAYDGPVDAWTRNKRALVAGGVGKDLFVSNCNGNRAISKKAAATYARVFGRSAGWYLYGDDAEAPAAEPLPASVFDVPRISWVTAGELGDQEAITDLSDYPTITASDLPAGRYIALKVDSDGISMNKISPPESVIFVNIDDKRLVANACYVIADEQGRATYKRYRPGAKPEFQPASYEKGVKPPQLEGAITVIGRVRRSMIDM